MLEDEPREKEDERRQDVAQAAEEPLTPEETDIVTGEVEAEEPDFGEGLLDPETGKLLGKFNDTNALARSYKELESHAGRTSSQAAEYKKALEAQGWTFDDAGKPVAPAPPPAAPPAPVQDPALPQGHQMVNGVLHDHLGIPVVSEAEWTALEEEDPAEYDRMRRQYDTLRIVRQEQYSQQQGTRQQQALEETKQNVRKIAKEQFFLDDDNITKIEAGVQGILAQVHPSVRGLPQAYEMAARAVASELLPGIYQEHLRQITAGSKEAIAKGQRVVAMERGTQNAPAPKSPSSYGLTADEKQMAKDLGVSEKDYAANK